jgi:DNA-binding transcriptional regulator of glucitol operon
VWRVVLSPRWLLWHLLALLAVAGCAGAAVWQWHRAGSAMGSALNVGYGIQWPLFALFFLYMWGRFLRNDLAEHRELRELAAGALAEPVVVEREPVPEPWDRTVNPFTRAPRAAEAISERESPALTEYNRMLAGLAAPDTEDTAPQVRSEP